MALDAVGSTIYVNQQMANVASEHNAKMGRVEMQNFAAGLAVSQAEKEIIEVRPTEDNQAIDEEKEHQKQEHDEEQKRSPKKKPEGEKASNQEFHHLDIKV